MNQIVLTTRLDSERSGLRRSTGSITEQQSKTCTGGDGNNPGERGTGQTVPGVEGGGGRVVTGVDALYAENAVGSVG